MRTRAGDPQAKAAYELVEGLQRHFVGKLDALSHKYGSGVPFAAVEWLREAGRFGGGMRYESRDVTLFNQASVNISQVHYEGDETKKLGSATAISTIIHPENPHAPSMHMHISWTQMKKGDGYWRIMADLNPAIEEANAKQAFVQMLEKVTGAHFHEGVAQGERYFYIPALKRHRGVAHFYLEGFSSGNFTADLAYAARVGGAVIDTYIKVVEKALMQHTTYDETARSAQLAYHTLYLFQVLTLDRGTTSGLLVHDQNDVGILGSLPKRVDTALLKRWKAAVPHPQEKLVERIVSVLERNDGKLNEPIRKALAEAVREHYRRFSEALRLQASGNTTPPTVENHR